ncbi:MAG: hypothetical protein ACI87J_002093 [Colwellia sp.]|jgi:hypothetical protein
MISFKRLTVIICFLAVTACSSINSAKVGELDIKNGTLYSGQIISIEQTKLNAEHSKRLAGGIIGHFIALGVGANSTLKFLSVMAGVAITNKEYEEVVDLIEVQSINGQRYKTYVPVDYFTINERVSFTKEDKMINSIVRT